MPVAAKKAKRHRGLSGCDWAQAPASQTLCTPNPKGNGSSAQGIPCIRRAVTGLCKRRLGCRPTRSNRFSVLTNKAPCLRDFRSRSIVCEVRVGAAPRRPTPSNHNTPRLFATRGFPPTRNTNSKSGLLGLYSSLQSTRRGYAASVWLLCRRQLRCIRAAHEEVNCPKGAREAGLGHGSDA